MADVFRYIIFPILITILLCIPAILFDIWFCKIGVSRDSKIEIIITTFVLVFLKQFFYKDLSWWISGIIVIFAATLSVHRFDFGKTLKHGKWWWATEEKKKKKYSNSK
jgi:hypothetical protein